MSLAYQHHPLNAVAGPSRSHGTTMDEVKREKKRKEISGKLNREMNDRRDDGRHYSETISMLHQTSVTLATRPDTSPLYNMKLLPFTFERSAKLVQLEYEERYALECAQTAYDEEREKVEIEWKKGHDRVRERLMESIEERRRRAREDKEGEGAVADGALDSQSRPHITRKLRNKMGTSPPPTPLGAPASAPNGAGTISGLPITSGPLLNPHSLNVDELPSPFPLPLTSTTIPTGPNGANASTGTGAGGGGRRRPKGSGTHQSQAIGGLGKSLAMLSGCKEQEIESDLGEIRRGNKRRRVTTGAGLGKTTL
ncbi:hypothetical protein IW262DRAFT_1392979 [Armillaria fumosa]|nr:hypothetical protein IW262DRAFT_1392979 [Armillaria fumosa]